MTELEQLQQEIEDLCWHIKNNGNVEVSRMEQAYLRGYREGFTKGSEAGLKVAADVLNKTVPQPVIILPLEKESL